MKRREFLFVGALTAGGYAFGRFWRSPVGHGSAEPDDHIASIRREPLGVVRGDVKLSTYTVAHGETLRFDPAADATMELTGNLVVEGTLEMKPGPGVTHTLRFVGIDETRFVGGGMDVLDADVGLWVIGRGKLDIQGAPRKGWNRTGTHPTWGPKDEILTTPFAPGDYTTFAPYSGNLSTVTGPDARVFTQEAFNLTRNVRIEGTPTGRAHIMIMSSAPQKVSYAAIRYVGPRKGNEPVLGRYGLHFHHAHEGSRGSMVVGTVVRDCGNHAFVPHMSNGVTFRDCIAYGVQEDAYWWDEGDMSNDTVWGHCMAAGLSSHELHNLSGFVLGAGMGNTCQDCVSAGNTNGREAAGFQWPSRANLLANVWTMRDNIAHNNAADGIRVWQNDFHHHVVERFVGFRNGRTGISHGAYRNRYTYDDALCFESGEAGLQVFANSKARPRPLEFNRCSFDNAIMSRHSLPPEGPAKFLDSRIGRVNVAEERSKYGGACDFIRCGLEPADWTVATMHPQSRYRVQRPNGTAYRVDPDGTATVIASFA